MRTECAKRFLMVVISCASLCTNALTNVSWDKFYGSLTKAESADEIECGIWYGRNKKTAEYCMEKAKQTGYLMFWFLYSYVQNNVFDCERFRKYAICRSSFVNVVNDYGYLILCASDYDDVWSLKNNLYGFKRNGKILDEATGEYVVNKNGYPKTVGDVGSVCSDHPPSLHLIKFDQNGTVILFHVFTDFGEYDMKFSPYATQFPIPEKMHWTSDAFAPWFKQYLDLFRAKEQIEEYVDSGGESQIPIQISTNVVRVDIAITETVHPTVYQIALHRNNVLFRAVTTMRDIMVKDRIECVPTKFDDRCTAIGRKGKWFINYDDTLSTISDSVLSESEIDIIPSVDCSLSIVQRFGNGFTLREYGYVATTNVVHQNIALETGEIIRGTVFTNVTMEASSTEYMHKEFSRGEYVERGLESGKLYRISVNGNATFDVFSTK